jgi:hypothetical protein
VQLGHTLPLPKSVAYKDTAPVSPLGPAAALNSDTQAAIIIFTHTLLAEGSKRSTLLTTPLYPPIEYLRQAVDDKVIGRIEEITLQRGHRCWRKPNPS